jgi:ATP-dependent exoDNAse (exonuclease V) beta subunit
VRILLNVFRFLHNPEDQLAIRNFIYDYSLETHQKEDVHQVFTGTTKVVDQILLDRSMLLQMPLFEMGAWLVRQLELDQETENTGFLFSFQQQLLDYTFQNRSDLAGFLEWWEQTGCKVSIPMSGELNACRILTIHTSKGLQFKNVIIPFCDWPLDHSTGRQPIIWCQNRLDFFPEISHFPLNYSSGLKGTLMQDDYLAERYKIALDNLNLLYVALTRAEDQLFLHVPAPESSTKSNPYIADFLHRLFLNSELEFKNSHWNARKQEFHLGEPVENLNKQVEPVYFDVFPPRRVTPWQQRIRIRRSNQVLMDMLNPEQADKIRSGNLIHQVLSRIDYTEDLAGVLDIMVHEGWIALESKEAMKSGIGELFAKPHIGKFFTRKWEVKNELPIISPEGQVRRPDRVIICRDQAVVIDYKTGEAKSSDHRQVITYMQLLQKMGYTEVEGYILYLENGELERINR